MNAASGRPEQGVAAGSLALVRGDYGADAEVFIEGKAARVIERATAGIVFLTPPDAEPGRVAIEVRAVDKAARGSFTIAPAGPGLFAQPLDPADAGSVIRLTATGVGSEPSVWIANQPADVVSSSPVDNQPGVWRIEVRVPASLAGAGQVPVFAASRGFQSNGLAIQVK